MLIQFHINQQPNTNPLAPPAPDANYPQPRPANSGFPQIRGKIGVQTKEMYRISPINKIIFGRKGDKIATYQKRNERKFRPCFQNVQIRRNLKR